MSDVRVKAVYDAVADDYANHFPSTESEQPIELAMVGYFASLLPGEHRRVLDAGCGAGRMLPVLAEAGCNAIGIDLSHGMVRRARRDHPDFNTYVGSIASIPFADTTFDGLFYWYSVIHTEDDALPIVLEEARRVLRPRGYILMAFQTGSGTHEVGQGYRRLGHDVRLHRHDRTPDHVARELCAAQMTEIARLVRGPAGKERSGQAVVIAQTVT